MKLKFTKIASIIKTHGLRGDVVLVLDNGFSYSLLDRCIKEGNAVFVSKDGIPVPFFISKNSLKIIDNDTFQCRLDDVSDIETAKEFIEDEVYLSSDCVKNKLNSTWLASNWIGFNIYDKKCGFIGVVVQFDDTIAKNPLIIVKKEGKELMIPANSDFIQSVDKNNKKINIKLPDGYLSIFD